MNNKICWQSKKADYVYNPDNGSVYRTMPGQNQYLFCGGLPRNLVTVDEVKQALLVKKLSGCI